MGAARENAQIKPAAAIWFETRRIARQVAKHGFRLCQAIVGGRRRTADTMRPALAEPELSDIRRDGDPIGIVQVLQGRAYVVEPRAAFDDAAVVALFHEVVPPPGRLAPH